MPELKTEALWLTAVLIGGAAGSAVRYAISRIASHFIPATIEAFPWHTFAINVSGSFVLGLVAVWYKSHPQPVWFFLLGTGFCGGFTTFSTFSLETLTLVEKDRLLTATVYAVFSVALGFAAAWAAVKLAR